MNLLRARVSQKADWWEMELLDLEIVADGADEAAVLREVSHQLKAEYQLALLEGRTPFVRLVRGTPPPQLCEAWNSDGKKFRQLQLPDAVQRALAAVLHAERPTPFVVKEAA